MSFYKPLCINNIPEINDTLILFREKKHLCARKKRKEENGDDIKKKTAMATTPLLLLYSLLHNLEADTQRMRMLIPIGAKQYEPANLSC